MTSKSTRSRVLLAITSCTTQFIVVSGTLLLQLFIYFMDSQESKLSIGAHL